MDNNRLWELLGRRTSGELTLQEQIELSGLLKENEDYEAFSSLISEVIKTSTAYSHIGDEKTEAFINNVNLNIHTSKSPVKIDFVRTYKYAIGIAATLLLFVGLGFYFSSKTKIHSVPNVVTTAKGSKSNITLPDGTKVWINADSKLSYDKSFGVSTRDVYLRGEAYFDVVKNPGHQFIVHTNTMDVKVVGTAFNVRAYNNEKTTEAILLRGAIEINLKNDNKKINLKPNEKITIYNDYSETQHPLANIDIPNISITKIVKHQADSSITETKWMRNELAFKHTSMNDLIPMLERWYNVKMVVKKAFPDTRKFSGDFEGHGIENVLESLKILEEFNYKVDKDTILIY